MTAIKQLNCIAKSSKQSQTASKSAIKNKPNLLASTWPLVNLVYFSKELKKERGVLKDPQFVYSSYVEKAVLEFETDSLKLQLLKSELETYIGKPIPNNQRLILWTNAINTKISKIHQIYPSLIRSLFKINWLELEEEYLKAFRKSLKYLLCSDHENFEIVLDYLVSFFSNKITSKPKVMAKLEEILLSMACCSPNYIPALLAKIDAKYPHISRSSSDIALYNKSVLNLADRLPRSKYKILQIIIKKAVQLDCEIVNDDEIFRHNKAFKNPTLIQKEKCFDDGGHSDEVLSDDSTKDKNEEHDLGEYSDHDQHTLNPDVGYDYDYERTKDLEAHSDEEDTIVEDDEQLPKVEYVQSELLQKLDSTMQMLFEYLAKAMPAKEREHMFCFMIKEFRTHYFSKTGMKYVQFIVFYFCSLEIMYIKPLLTLFFKEAISIRPNTILSAQYTSYLSSFLSRANYIHPKTVLDWSRLVMQWLVKHVRKMKPMSYKNSFVENSIFYSLAQAIMYIFCFRWKDLVDYKATRACLFQKLCFYKEFLHFKEVLECMMSPLKVCPSNIVSMFMNVNKVTKFLILDIDKINSTITVRKKPHFLKALKGYFPFEPFNLNCSRSYIDPLFKNFEDVDSKTVRRFIASLKNKPPNNPQPTTKQSLESEPHDSSNFEKSPKKVKLTKIL